MFKCGCFYYSSFPFKCRQWALSAWSLAIRACWIQRNRQFVVLLIRTGAATNIGINKALHRRLLPGFVFCQCCWMIDISILFFSLNCFSFSFFSVSILHSKRDLTIQSLGSVSLSIKTNNLSRAAVLCGFAMPAPLSLVGICVRGSTVSCDCSSNWLSWLRGECALWTAVKQKQGYQWPERKAFRRTLASHILFCAFSLGLFTRRSFFFLFSLQSKTQSCGWVCEASWPCWVHLKGKLKVHLECGKTCPHWLLSCQQNQWREDDPGFTIGSNHSRVAG